MYRDFGTIFLFLLLGILLIALILWIQRLVAPSNPTADKLTTYECGEEAEGSAWVQFNIRFYVIALIFLIFDVEVVFLYPWAVVFHQLGWFGFVEMAVFLAILILGLAYVWRKADLDWVKLRVKYGAGRYRKLSALDDEAV
ncbi:MAG: NADH-quinone oxidoreductase subunit A [Candidatus Neomarinimicrobiota bacterium]|nr:MAG: NADH-quinone oxidoreductase subunit A [Candidatus Neomarinimicrobiota bacterium]